MEARFVLILALFSLAVASYHRSNLLSDYCKKLSKQDIPWSVTIDPKHAKTWDQAKRLLGFKKNRENATQLPFIEHDENDIKIPAEFDSRKQWAECSDIVGHIKDQGPICGSCWAQSSVGVMSDRICIHSKGKVKEWVSAQDLMDCCSECGKSCQGGYSMKAFEYWQKKGLVSGGDNYGEGCKQYQAQDEQCVKKCDEGTELDYQKQLTFATSAYGLKNETQMQLEILKNGPITATFTVYEDFMCYDGKVYWHQTNVNISEHSVRIIGWGVEDQKPYWLIANSWGSNWALNYTNQIQRYDNNH